MYPIVVLDGAALIAVAMDMIEQQVEAVDIGILMFISAKSLTSMIFMYICKYLITHYRSYGASSNGRPPPTPGYTSPYLTDIHSSSRYLNKRNTALMNGGAGMQQP